jgi:HTH-type transcriptional regulator/antitoxin HipB
MIELNEVIDELKKDKKEFADFDDEFENVKIGYMLKVAREKSGFTQEKIAELMKTYKGNISRIENHAEDIKLSTIKNYVKALGKNLIINIK